MAEVARRRLGATLRGDGKLVVHRPAGARGFDGPDAVVAAALDSKLTLTDLAKRCGFATVTLMSVTFRRDLGVRPGGVPLARGLDETEA